MSSIVSDNAGILGEEVDVVQIPPVITISRFSWSAAIAGAFAAIAVTFIVISLGSGIGLSVASPYRAPSAATLTLMGAVWLVMAQALGFACGGYLATRMRGRFADDLEDEVRFRDGAHGFLFWALGVVITALFVVIAGNSALRAAANATLSTGTSAASA